MDVQFFRHHLIEETILFPLCVFDILVKDQLTVHAWMKFGLSLLFHWPVRLCACQYHAVLTTVSLYFILQPGIVMLSGLVLLLKIKVINITLAFLFFIGSI